jgi:hypothetical protein
MSTSGSFLQGGRHAEHLSRELHEIGNQIQLAQTQTRNALAARLGLPRLYQQDDYHAVAVQLDACLNKWENGLPSDWTLENLNKVVDRTSRAERYLLHLRYAPDSSFVWKQRAWILPFYHISVLTFLTPALVSFTLESSCTDPCSHVSTL